MVFCVLDRYWAQMTVCINLFSMLFHQKGEHFLEKSRLYLSTDRTWGTILKKTPAVPKNRGNFKNTWGTNHKKTLLCLTPETAGKKGRMNHLPEGCYEKGAITDLMRIMPDTLLV
jgi:hypothetical protein